MSHKQRQLMQLNAKASKLSFQTRLKSRFIDATYARTKHVFWCKNGRLNALMLMLILAWFLLSKAM